MLVITRKLGEKIHIGDDIVVHLLNVDAVKAKIGIEAPRHIRVLRDNAVERERSERSQPSKDELEERLWKAEALACKQAKALDERDREIERLLALQGELLAALKEFAGRHVCGCYHLYCSFCDRDKMAANAIAKAEGRRPADG